MATNSKKVTNVILGGGISGLQLGKELAVAKEQVQILEKSSCVGGMCSSFKYKGYTFDLGPHKFYTQLEGINEEFFKIIGNDYIKVKKKNSIFVLGKPYQFPIQMSQLLLGLGPKFSIKFAGSFAVNTVKNIVSKKFPQNYEEYFKKGFGEEGYKLLFEGYAWKVWGNPKELSVELAQKRVPVSSVVDLLKKMFFQKKDPSVSAEFFFYPKNGFGEICNQLIAPIENNKGKIIKEIEIIKINHVNKRISSVEFISRGKKEELLVDNLISTIKLKEFVTLLSPKAPIEVIAAANGLKYRSLIILYLIINKDQCLKDNWIFFPEKEYIFNRISEQKSFSAKSFPEGKTALMVEITCDKKEDMFVADTKDIFSKALIDLKKAKIILNETEVDDFFVKKIEEIYPIYSLEYKQNLTLILHYLNGFENVYTLGRNGLFNYNNADHCIDMSKKTVNHILNKKPREEWIKLIEYFDNYKIVD